MAKQKTMAAKLAAQSAKRKAELQATVNGIKGENAPTVEGEPKKTPRKRTIAAKPKATPQIAPTENDDDTIYEAKRGRKAKYQKDDPRHPTTIVFTESQYQRLRKYAFEHDMSISGVLLEGFQMLDRV